MRRYFGICFALTAVFMLMGLSAGAQNPLNAKPESIIGNYSVDRAQFKGKVKVFCESDGTYKAQLFYVENATDPKTGEKMKDEKNPDKSLRGTPCDRIVILYGLKYNEKKQCWDGGKVYDPTYGIRANATVEFAPDGRLKVEGSLMGIREHVFWTRL